MSIFPDDERSSFIQGRPWITWSGEGPCAQTHITDCLSLYVSLVHSPTCPTKLRQNTSCSLYFDTGKALTKWSSFCFVFFFVRVKSLSNFWAFQTELSDVLPWMPMRQRKLRWRKGEISDIQQCLKLVFIEQTRQKVTRKRNHTQKNVIE